MGSAMSCGNAGEEMDPEQKARNKEIESQLRRDKKNFERELKILLLGAGESGKSTIVKQMKLIYMKGFTDDEREPFIPIIYSNVIMSMRALVLACEKLGLEVSEDAQKHARLFRSSTILFDQVVTDEIAEAVAVLWVEPSIQQAFTRAREFQLNDSAGYFFDNLDRIKEEEYLPTDQDLLRARARTSGINEVVFTIGDTGFRMVDVGGQRSERKKWIHCFQDVTSLIFFVALSEYDLSLREDSTVNRMHESIALFEEICNCQWFAETGIILFLNKSDLFKEKIKKVDLAVCFPDYQGGTNYQPAIDFIDKKFSSLNRVSDRTVYSHVTCATNTDQIKFVFKSVREHIIEQSLLGTGVL